MKKRIIGVAIGVVIGVFALGGGYLYAYNTPASYVSVDINPSVELVLNTFDTVIEVNAMNEDAEKLVTDLDLENTNVDSAVKDIVNEAVDQGYISEENKNEVLIGVATEDEQKADEITNDTQEAATEVIAESGVQTEVTAEKVGFDRVQRARELGTTPGKLNLVEKYAASTGDAASVNVEDWLKRPVKDIMKAIKENKKDGKTNTDLEPGASAQPSTSADPSATPQPETTLQPATSAQNGTTTAPAVTTSPKKNDKAQNNKNKNTDKIKDIDDEEIGDADENEQADVEDEDTNDKDKNEKSNNGANVQNHGQSQSSQNRANQDKDEADKD